MNRLLENFGSSTSRTDTLPAPRTDTLRASRGRVGRLRLLLLAPLTFLALACSDEESPPETASEPRPGPTVQDEPAGVEMVRGMLVLGPEVRSLKPCEEEAELWVIPVESLQQAYDGLAMEPYAPVFVELDAVREAAPETGFGTEYAAQLRVRAVRRAAPATESLGCDEDLSGFAFRASGQEPFWHVRVTPQSITMSTPEIPSTIFAATDPVRLDEGWRYMTEASGPEPVRMTLDLVRQDCSDTMVGARYSWTARLDIGGDVRTGCAWEGARSPER